MQFKELTLNEKIIQGTEDAGFTECMPVQEQAIPPILENKDIFVQSQTGSGKTAAFLIPVFQHFLSESFPFKKKALIIAPTRELATQIEKDARILGKHTGLTTGTFYGGVGYAKQEELLKNDVDIMVGTPGRVIDLAEQKKMKLKDTGVLIIDEADRLFDMGFFPDLKRILRMMPRREERLTMLFSATLNDQVKSVADNFMREPVEITMETDSLTVEGITQQLYHVGAHEKINLLLGLMKKHNPSNAIIFTNTKRAAHEVAKRMEHNGYHTQFMIGDLPQSKRETIIAQAKSGEVPFLIATDVAARGLHVDDLEMVINYDLPEHSENYVHRIGRTARAGKTGLAISMACEKFVYALDSIERLIEMKIPVEWADDEMFLDDSSAGMSFHVQRKSSERLHHRRKEGSGDKGQRRQGPQRKKSSRNEQIPSQRKGPAQKNDGAPHSSRKKNTQTKQGNTPAQSKAPRKKNREAMQHTRTQAAQEPAILKGGRKKSLDARLEYYQKKYGENFSVKSEKVPEKKGLLDKIKGIFGG